MCKEFIVSGRVQGIGFRFAAKRKADSLGITGHAKNLADGTVEILACGNMKSIDKLGEWLEKEGPHFARIDNVYEESTEIKIPPENFIAK